MGNRTGCIYNSTDSRVYGARFWVSSRCSCELCPRLTAKANLAVCIVRMDDGLESDYVSMYSLQGLARYIELMSKEFLLIYSHLFRYRAMRMRD